MIGRLLDDQIAGAEGHGGVIELHVNLALQDDRVIDGLGEMHQGMVGRVTLASLHLKPQPLRHLRMIHRRDFSRGRRKIHHAEDGAAHRRRQTTADVGCVARHGDVGGGLVGGPDPVGDDARVRARDLAGHMVVEEDDGLAILSMTGDHPAHRPLFRIHVANPPIPLPRL